MTNELAARERFIADGTDVPTATAYALRDLLATYLTDRVPGIELGEGEVDHTGGGCTAATIAICDPWEGGQRVGTLVVTSELYAPESFGEVDTVGFYPAYSWIDGENAPGCCYYAVPNGDAGTATATDIIHAVLSEGFCEYGLPTVNLAHAIRITRDAARDAFRG